MLDVRSRSVLLCLFASVGGACEMSASDDPDPGELDKEGQLGEIEQAVTCSPPVVYYPVRGRHNHGYDSKAGNSSLWTCNADRSNSDFVAGDHLGNDIWAAQGTPVVATTAGTATLTGYSSYSGNKVTIADKCGWYHFYAHLKSIAPGISNGKHVPAGTVIGYVGKTGTASNGVVHLHYSIYPAGNYNGGRDPWAYTRPKESNVCNLPLNTPPPPPPHYADIEKVAAAPNRAGKLELFWIGANGALFHSVQGPGWPFGAFGSAAKKLAIATNADGRLELFYIGTNDQLYHRYQTSTTTLAWSAEAAMGTTARDLAVGTLPDGRLQVFYTTTGHAIRSLWQTVPSGGWSAHAAMGGYAKDLVVANNADGRMELFYIGTNDRIYHRYRPMTGAWSAELPFNVTARDLVVGRNKDGRLELFYTSPTDAISHIYQTAPNGSWSAPRVFGGAGEQLAVHNNADGRLELWVIGTNKALYHRWQTVANGSWSAWSGTGQPGVKLDIARNVDGRLEAFYLTSSNGMRHMYQSAPNSGWSGAAVIGGAALEIVDETQDVTEVGAGWPEPALDGIGIEEMTADGEDEAAMPRLSIDDPAQQDPEN